MEDKTKSDGSTASYYTLPPDSSELQDIISAKDMNSQIGEIFRACMRYGEVSHSSKLRDAKKIKFYAEAEIKRLEKSELLQTPSKTPNYYLGLKRSEEANILNNPDAILKTQE